MFERCIRKSINIKYRNMKKIFQNLSNFLNNFRAILIFSQNLKKRWIGSGIFMRYKIEVFFNICIFPACFIIEYVYVSGNKVPLGILEHGIYSSNIEFCEYMHINTLFQRKIILKAEMLTVNLLLTVSCRYFLTVDLLLRNYVIIRIHTFYI